MRIGKILSLTRMVFVLTMFQSEAWTAELTSFVLSSNTSLDVTKVGNKIVVANFMVLNPSSGNFDLYISFTNSCNIKHFRRSDLIIPLSAVRLRINGVEEAVNSWTRAATDCTSPIIWSPTNPYSDRYQVEVLVSWTGTLHEIAGAYSETATIHAFSNP